MVHKLALAVGGLAAAGVLALALGAAGFTPRTSEAKAADSVVAADAGVAQKKTVTDTVYVKPTPQPRVIHVTKPTAHPHRQQVVTDRAQPSPRR